MNGLVSKLRENSEQEEEMDVSGWNRKRIGEK